MTKRFEEVRRDSLDVLAAQYDGESPKGEIVIAVAPPADEPEASAEGLDALLVSFLGEMSLRDAVAEAVDRTGLDRKQVYARALELKERAERESANGS
jgi:16S rRNA (cytidine1402-2'-O)-methyltransferase